MVLSGRGTSFGGVACDSFLLEASLRDSLKFRAMFTICADSISRGPLFDVVLTGDDGIAGCAASTGDVAGLAIVLPVSLVSVLVLAAAASANAPPPPPGVVFAWSLERALSAVPEACLDRW